MAALATPEHVEPLDHQAGIGARSITGRGSLRYSTTLLLCTGPAHAR
jgi:hypothetical protein